MDMLNAQLAPKAGPFTIFLIRTAAVNEDVLRLCPSRDWECTRNIGLIMVGSWSYQTALLSIIGHRLFGHESLHPEVILGACFIATFILLIDSFMVMRSGWQLSGIAELKRGGLDISGGPAARIKAAFFLVIRVGLSAGLAQLTAIIVAMLVFGTDIASQLRSVYLQANAALLAQASTLVDREIQSMRDAVKAQSARFEALAAQAATLRQTEVDPASADPGVRQAQDEVTQAESRKAKADEEVQAAETFASNEMAGIKGAAGNSGQAGNGPRRRAAMEQVANARRHAGEASAALDAARSRLAALRAQSTTGSDEAKRKAHERLPAFDAAVAAEGGKLADEKEKLVRLVQGRDEAIRRTVENAPNHVPFNDGLLAQIKALEHLAQDPKIATVIILLDVVSFGFELAAVLVKITSYVPTCYAGILARDAFLHSVQMVDDISAALKVEKQPDCTAPGHIVPDDPTPDDLPPERPSNGPGLRLGPNGAGPHSGSKPFDGGPDQPPPDPPKRPRGRPRKPTHH